VAEVFDARLLLEAPERFAGMSPPAILGVFGSPVGHSLSPQFQNAALDAAGVNGQYVRLEATEEIFLPAVRALGRAGFRGANVTIPFKVAAMEAVDEVDEEARQAGGVNTVVVQGDRLLGFSTDGMGFSRAIREEFLLDLKDLRVMILGAGGGAGRAAAVRCAAEGCERLVLVNRTVEKVRGLARALAPKFHSERLAGPADRLVAIGMDEGLMAEQLEKIDLVVNATSLGMRLGDRLPLPTRLITANLLVFDMVYTGRKTRLVLAAESAGARAADGLSMLLHQGALSFELWFEGPAPIDAMRRALRQAAGR